MVQVLLVDKQDLAIFTFLEVDMQDLYSSLLMVQVDM